jgi:hypothetical protein
MRLVPAVLLAALYSCGTASAAVQRVWAPKLSSASYQPELVDWCVSGFGNTREGARTAGVN